VVDDNYQNDLLSNKVKIPNAWTGSNAGKTRTMVMHQHRSEFIPHPSYDIDGDGIVGGRDLVLAKRFDEDKDGILNEKEKQNAINAINNGIEKNFMWGVEVSGPNKSYRVLQKRGMICDADDFSQIKETYPEFPEARKQPLHKTITEMKEMRKIKDKEKLEIDKQEWDKKHPSSISRPFILSEFFIKNPKHTSVKQIKNELKEEIRKKAGLKPVGDFSVDEKPMPTLSYIATPGAVSKQHLIEIRKKANLTEFKHMEKKQGNTEIGIDRLIKKEECVFRMGHGDNRKTKHLIEEIRKKEMLENNMKVFGNDTIGIHGKELPKYQHTMKEWWMNKRGFNSSPNETSYLRFKQNMKYWVKNEDHVLKDITGEPAGPDDFKNLHIPKTRKNQIATSPNKINWVKKKEYRILGGTSEKPKRNFRWTSLEDKFVQRDNKFTADVDKTRAERCDYEPLFSSFNQGGRFIPPPSAKDILNQQKEQIQKTSASLTMTNKSKGLRGLSTHHLEESLMATANASTNLFKRVGPVEGSPVKCSENNFRMTTYKGIRSGGFYELGSQVL
jgi:hypothetical protein